MRDGSESVAQKVDLRVEFLLAIGNLLTTIINVLPFKLAATRWPFPPYAAVLALPFFWGRPFIDRRPVEIRGAIRMGHLSQPQSLHPDSPCGRFAPPLSRRTSFAAVAQW